MRYLALFILLAGLSFMAGCASETDSSMPWNTPQSWEGAPSIPGFSQPGR